MRSEARITLLCAAIVSAVLPAMLACGSSDDGNCAEGVDTYTCDCCHGPGCTFPGEKKKEWSTVECAQTTESALAQVYEDVRFRSPHGTTDYGCSCALRDADDERALPPDTGDSGR